MQKKKLVYTGMVTLMSLALVGCGGNKATDKDVSKNDDKSDKKEVLAKDQVLTTNVTQEMPTADISLSTDVISAVALNNCYEGIYRLGKDSQPEPAGATEKAEVSEDGKIYKVKLKEDAKWSDGKPVTAADYVYSWQRTVDPKTASEYAYLHGCVKNAEDIIAGKKDKSELGIKAVSDYELEIELDRATPYFDYLLAFSTFMPQRQDIVEKWGKDYATTSEKSVYNGPFVLAEFDGPGTDTEWSYKKNDQYWDKKVVKLDEVKVSVVKEASTSLNLYQDNKAEEITLSGELAQQMANDPEYVIDKKASVTWLEMNMRDEKSPFKNENLRKAIAYSIDRKALVNQILGDGSVDVQGIVPADMAKNPESGQDFVKDSGKHLSYNEEKAKDYWEKAKKELKVDSLKFDILASDTDSSKKVIEYIQGAIQDTLEGVKVTVSPVPFAVRLDRSNSGDFDTVLSGWNADYADPSSFTDLFVTGNSYNRGHYTSKDYDAKVKASAVEHATEPEKRWQDMVDAEKIIMDDMGVVPVYQKAEAHLRTAKVKDLVVHSTGAPFTYKWAYKVE